MAFSRSRLRRALLWTIGVGIGVGSLGATWLAHDLLRDLPDLESIADYRPPQTSVVRDRDGHIIGEFSTERRTLAPMGSIPAITKQSFVSAEDAGFFEHTGVDFKSILRAAWVDLLEGRIKQGASTITMQLVKQMLLSTDRTFRRKFRQMILARELEQHFGKDEILWLYLNQIYFGQGAWGIAEAARTYFDKDVSELDLSESALLAGLPQRPSEYSPIRSPKSAERRRRYVLGRLLGDRVIDSKTYEEALANPPEIHRPAYRQDLRFAGYFTEEVRRFLYQRLGGEVTLEGGLEIETTLDSDLQRAAVAALRQGLRDHDHRQGFRGPLRQVLPEAFESELKTLATANDLEADGDLPASLPGGVPLDGLVVSLDPDSTSAKIAFGAGLEGVVRIDDVAWARSPDPKRLPVRLKKIEDVFAVGDVARFSVLEGEDTQIAEALNAGDEPASIPPALVTLFQEPLVQGALLSLEVASGDVLALVGGYDFDGSEFDRVTQARRQPGSAFKPLIYGAALDRDYTPVTTLWDRPAVYTDPVSGFVWRPQNYGRKFYGRLPLRSALARSVNNATVHLFRDVGVGFVIDYAKRLGIRSPLARDLSLALGSSGVSLLELTTAYAVFPNAGRKVVPRFITRVTDANGQVLFEDVTLDTGETASDRFEQADPDADEVEFAPLEETLAEETPDPNQVISEENAFLVADLLQAVVFDPGGTGWRLRQLNRPVAGKTGTTNDQADAWFMGFSPEIATGVWVGHDETRLLGRGETGSRAAAPIWVAFMKEALRDRPRRDFPAPAGIVFQRIDRETGLLAGPESRHAYFQPFLAGTEPVESSDRASSVSDAARALRAESF